ncbi:hypothetical protein C7M84_001339, partial [Penaeus vannamei]
STNSFVSAQTNSLTLLLLSASRLCFLSLSSPSRLCSHSLFFVFFSIISRSPLLPSSSLSSSSLSVSLSLLSRSLSSPVLASLSLLFSSSPIINPPLSLGLPHLSSFPFVLDSLFSLLLPAARSSIPEEDDSSLLLSLLSHTLPSPSLSILASSHLYLLPPPAAFLSFVLLPLALSSLTFSSPSSPLPSPPPRTSLVTFHSAPPRLSSSLFSLHLLVSVFSLCALRSLASVCFLSSLSALLSRSNLLKNDLFLPLVSRLAGFLLSVALFSFAHRDSLSLLVSSSSLSPRILSLSLSLSLFVSSLSLPHLPLLSLFSPLSSHLRVPSLSHSLLVFSLSLSASPRHLSPLVSLFSLFLSSLSFSVIPFVIVCYWYSNVY